ncbi:tetratricopeptide repeat protein [Oceanospirillum sanctuarii]|uniref:tetratricopeptide repeat protein n=1 Tax=Oceanospirillum sanctuarii TaxID=1434821 RepID=UPI00159470D1|nr:tetratricopeptide repeat protein [Oceanospirillum sanctuarii]
MNFLNRQASGCHWLRQYRSGLVFLLMLTSSLTFSGAQAANLTPAEFKQLQEIQALQTEARWLEVKTLVQAQLSPEDSSKQVSRLMQAMLWRALAQAELQEADYAKALTAIRNAWQLKQLPEADQLNLQGLLAQLMIQQDELYQGILLFEDWLAKTPEDQQQARHYLTLAQAYSQQESWSKALPNAEEAVKRHESAPVSWLALLVGLHTRLEQWPQAVNVQKRILIQQPRQMRHWRQLAMLQYRLPTDERKDAVNPEAVASLRIAWQQQLFDRTNDYQLLSQWLNANGQPLKAAQVLADAQQQPVFTALSEEQQLVVAEQLAGLWLRAKSWGKAEQSLQQVASHTAVKDNPERSAELYKQIARLQMQQKKWQVAGETLNTLLAEYPADPAEVLLLQGIVLLQQEQVAAAEGKFQLAEQSVDPDSDKYVGKNARQWLRYIEQIRS